MNTHPYEVTIIFRSGEQVNFTCDDYEQKGGADEFRYTFYNMEDDDGVVVHFNYRSEDVSSVTINAPNGYEEDADDEE